MDVLIGRTLPRLGFLFPGQGSAAHLDGGILRRRFPAAAALYERAHLPVNADGVPTQVAQPAIVTASAAALAVLRELGIEGGVAVGHSLGELTALHWGGAIDADSLLRIATARGRAMAEFGDPTGEMLQIGASREEAIQLLDGLPIVVAGVNAPSRTVVAGSADAIAAVAERAHQRGLVTQRLSVSHAFHSPLVAEAAQPFAEYLAQENCRPLRRTVSSTITGGTLAPDSNLCSLLERQVTAPVLFLDAVMAVHEQVDVWIEVGPGRTLTTLVGEFIDTPAAALDAGGASIKGLLQAIGAAFVLGAPVRTAALFDGRFARPFDLERRPSFFVNPCELTALDEEDGIRGAESASAPEVHTADHAAPVDANLPTTNGYDASAELPPASSVKAVSPLELIRRLVAERAELPIGAVRDSDRLLGDLHLNSITVSQLVAEAARQLDLPSPAAPLEYSGATLAQVAEALEEVLRTGGASSQVESDAPPGVDSWIRPFVVELVERPLIRRRAETGTGSWQVIAPPEHLLLEPLRERLSSVAGPGIAVCLPPDPDERHVGLLLEGAHALLQESGPARFLLVQHGGGGAAFARTLYLEAPDRVVSVVDVPADHPGTVNWILDEAAAAIRFTEAHYDQFGRRYEPVLRVHQPAAVELLPLGPEDVLLVTGGGKGIAAECALALARETGVRLALIGRSDPNDDPTLAANLERIASAGMISWYGRADVTDRAAVHSVVQKAEGTLGPITGVLHGAGSNTPQLLRTLDESAFLRTLAPKVQGLRNVLACADPDRLRLVVAFGSIIGRIGLRGEADYAVANEWLGRVVERFGAEHPHCRCVTLDWSVWSGVGMGERLGRVEALMRAGITPIPVDAGVSILCELLTQTTPPSVTVAGRFGPPPTVQFEHSELPLLRFLERPRVHYPGIELVVDAELSLDTDLYLRDHILQGEPVFPAVMGLEAMAQAAMALTGAAEPPSFENVAFERPVVIAEGQRTTIRIVALVREPDLVEVALRAETTSFQVDHFRAHCRFRSVREAALSRVAESPALPLGPTEKVSLDPRTDLYGGLLFHGERFRRLDAYRRLAARECVATFSHANGARWFSAFLPADLVLDDPGTRDAAIHAIQACIPHATILPIGVEQLVRSAGADNQPACVWAREREQDGDSFVYDMEVTSADGTLLEWWSGLRLRRIGDAIMPEPWPTALLGPYLERRLAALIPDAPVSVVIHEDLGAERRQQSDQALQRALRAGLPIRRRPDGKPEVYATGTMQVSTAHAGPLTLAANSAGPIGCDLERVVARSPSEWRDLLGPEGFELAEIIGAAIGEDRHTSATRLWTAREGLRKAGAPANTPLVLRSCSKDGWVLLGSGQKVIGTFLATIRGVPERVALALAVEPSSVPFPGLWSDGAASDSLYSQLIQT